MSRLYARQTAVQENAPFIGAAGELWRALWHLSMARYQVLAVRISEAGADIHAVRTAQADPLRSDDGSEPEQVEHQGKPLCQAWVHGCRVRWDDNAERPALLKEK